MPKPDLTGRTLAECASSACPFPGKVIDLTAGAFVTDATGAWHSSCYAEKAAPKANEANVNAARVEDAKLADRRDKAIASDALAAAQAAYDAQVAAWQKEYPGQPHPFGPRPSAKSAARGVDELTAARADVAAPDGHAPVPVGPPRGGDMPPPPAGTHATPGVPG